MATQELAKREEHPISIAKAIQEGADAATIHIGVARGWATALQAIVEDRQLFAMIGGKKHLEAEAWQTIVALDGACMVPEWTRPLMEGEEIAGYTARVNITKNGAIVSAGEMVCGFEEFPCRGKEGIAKHRAAMSAAQTWAGAKAARMKYAWIVVLAGYSGTPADEMKLDGSVPAPPDPAFLCPTHKVEWFRRGKMTGYAHPIGEKVEGQKQEWCSKPVQQAEPPAVPQGQASPKESQQAIPQGRVTNDQLRAITALRQRPECDLTEAELVTHLEQWIGVPNLRDLTQQQAAETIKWLQKTPQPAQAQDAAKGEVQP